MLKAKKFWIPVGVLVLLLILSIGLLEFSSTPTFCRMCHVMEPYFEAWRTSNHKDVPCVDCHIPPEPKAAIWAKFQTINSVVQYITKRYGTRPHAEIEDAACLRKGCHETRLLKAKVTFKRGIVFDHTVHLQEWRRGRKLRCTSCHSQIVVGKHIEVTTSTCFLCHFKGKKVGRELHPLAGCPSCHPAPKVEVEVDGVRFSHKEFVESIKIPCQKCHRDVIQGGGEAPRDRCLNCHNKPERLSRYQETKFMHIIHVTNHKVDCTFCHHEIQHKVLPVHIRNQVKRCEICHINTHLFTEKLFRGEGGKGAPNIPSHMLVVRLDCAACHSFRKELPSTPGGGQTMVASEQVCADCHQEQWKGMVHDWKETLNRMLHDVEEKLAQASLQLKSPKAPEDQGEVKALLEQAAFNLDYVKRARGVHNPFYAAELIVAANRSLDALFGKIGQKPPPLPKDSPVKGGYCALLCHRKAGVEMPQQVTFHQITFPHKDHAFRLEMGCTTCHSAERHKAISMTKQQCSSCHHQRVDAPCGSCHREIQALYRAELLPVELQSAAPNSMADVVDCTGCHTDPPSHSLKSVKEACLNCHQEDYLSWLDVWRESVSNSEKKLATLAGMIREDSTRKTEAHQIKDFLEKAQGVHNPSLYEALVEELEKRLK
jgi:nitrate/TMAO reductase-like tetraheme cytochrome c subunit